MVCKNRGVYGSLYPSWVLINVAPRNRAPCFWQTWRPTCACRTSNMRSVHVRFGAGQYWLHSVCILYSYLPKWRTKRTECLPRNKKTYTWGCATIAHEMSPNVPNTRQWHRHHSFSIYKHRSTLTKSIYLQQHLSRLKTISRWRRLPRCFRKLRMTPCVLRATYHVVSVSWPKPNQLWLPAANSPYEYGRRPEYWSHHFI